MALSICIVVVVCGDSISPNVCRTSSSRTQSFSEDYLRGLFGSKCFEFARLSAQSAPTQCLGLCFSFAKHCSDIEEHQFQILGRRCDLATTSLRNGDRLDHDGSLLEFPLLI